MNGFVNNLSDLEMICHNNAPIVLALQEVHRTTPDLMNKSLSGRYRWTYKRGQNIYHSVAIGILAQIPFSPIQIDTILPIIAVRIEFPIPISIVSFYLPCGKIDNLNEQLLRICEQIPEPRILLGDCNGHHPIWGSASPNLRGTVIAELVETADLMVLNDGCKTYYNGERQTSIDISMISTSIANRFLWSASDDPMNSDHVPISIFLNDAPPKTSRRPRWVYDQANWETYQNCIEESLDTVEPQTMSDLVNIINGAATAAIPKTSAHPGRRALAWWSPETKKAVKARRKALRAAKRIPDGHPNKEDALLAYRSARNECRQCIRNAKLQSWNKFLDSINDQQTPTELWNKVNSLNGKRKMNGLAIRHQGTITREPSVVANVFADYFADLSAIQRYNSSFIRANNVSTDSINQLLVPADNNHEINSPFSLMELNYALSKGKGSSAGSDEIGYPMLKNLTERGRRFLLKLLNQEWINNTLPESWKHSLIVPIPKSKLPSSEPNNFRPISLTSCVSKVLERMVNRRLIQYLTDGNFLDHRQHAFRPGHGTGSYFATLGQVLNDALLANHHVEIAILDLEKAYNRAYTPNVFKTLTRWGLSGNIMHFIKNFLSKRTFQVLIGNHRSTVATEETGVPQGSVIAVTLFLIAMNGVFEKLPKGIYIFVYADDIVLVAVGKHPVALRRKLQAAVTAVTKWADSTGFNMSADKSVRTHVCSLKHRPPLKPVTIRGIAIPFKKTVRILGVYIDRRLSFVDHCTHVKKECKTRLNLLKVLAKNHTVNNRKTRLKAARAIIDSKLLYGIELSCRASDMLCSKLAPIYNNAIRITSGLLPSTPAVAACIESGSLPFEYKFVSAICRRAVSFLEKTSHCDTEVFILGEANRLLRTVANQTLPPVAETYWTGARGWRSPAPKLDLSIKRHFKAGDNTAALRSSVTHLLVTEYRYHTQRYTDGSKACGQVGIGVCGADVNISHRLSDICSVFSAEAMAVFLAASQPSNQPVVILSDSASVIQALNSSCSQHPWIQATQAILDNNNNITFIWIPGHCGIPGNETADKLASQGRLHRRRYTQNVPGQDIKKWINNIVGLAWAKDWSDRRDPFIRKIKGDTDRWTDTQGYKDQKVLSRLRTGHTRVSHNMAGGSNFHKQCDLCGISNSVEHFISSCPKFDDLRKLYNIGSIRDALCNDAASEAATIRFLKDAELFDHI